MTLVEKLCSTKKGRLLYQQEVTILEITEKIAGIMIDDKITKKELYNRLKEAKRPLTHSYIKECFEGISHMTIGEMSNIFTVLGYQIKLDVEKIK